MLETKALLARWLSSPKRTLWFVFPIVIIPEKLLELQLSIMLCQGNSPTRSKKDMCCGPTMCCIHVHVVSNFAEVPGGGILAS